MSTDQTIAELYAMADIREAIGDPAGRLMLSEVVQRVQKLARIESAACKVCVTSGRREKARAMQNLAELMGVKVSPA